MDFTTLTSLIGSLGFPIVCCGALFWFLNEMTKRHKEELESLSEAIDNNTKVMNELIAKIGRE